MQNFLIYGNFFSWKCSNLWLFPPSPFALKRIFEKVGKWKIFRFLVKSSSTANIPIDHSWKNFQLLQMFLFVWYYRKNFHILHSVCQLTHLLALINKVSKSSKSWKVENFSIYCKIFLFWKYSNSSNFCIDGWMDGWMGWVGKDLFLFCIFLKNYLIYDADCFDAT